MGTERLRHALAEYALNLNLVKCCIQTNADLANDCLVVEGVGVPIVNPSEGFQILGTRLTLKGRTSAEVLSRINAGWAKFHQRWPPL